MAIDGSKFKAVNNRDKNFTDRKLKARMQQLDESIARYMTELDRADREPALVTEARVEHIKQKVETVKKQMRELKRIGKQMAQALDGQVSLTDPDARSMATSGRGTGMVGYNVQTAVDAKHHMIVAHEVTNVGHDRDRLYRWPSRHAMPSIEERLDGVCRSRLLQRPADLRLRASRHQDVGPQATDVRQQGGRAFRQS